MAAAGIAGLLRSVAKKLAHAPPLHHRLAAPGTHGFHPGLSRCAFRPFGSSHAGSNNKVTQKNKKIVSNPDSANKVMMRMACFMMFGCVGYLYGWVIPTMNRVNGKLIAASKARSEREDKFIQDVRHECEKMRSICREHHEFMKSLVEATDSLTNNFEAKTGRTSGNGKERGGVRDF